MFRYETLVKLGLPYKITTNFFEQHIPGLVDKYGPNVPLAVELNSNGAPRFTITE